MKSLKDKQETKWAQWENNPSYKCCWDVLQKCSQHSPRLTSSQGREQQDPHFNSMDCKAEIQCQSSSPQFQSWPMWLHPHPCTSPGFSCSPVDQPRQSHTYASMVGIAYFPVLVSMAPFVLGSFTSIIKLLGIPVLFLILGTDSKFLSC